MRFNTDGLNDLNYKLRFIREKRLYTWISVDIEETSVLQKHRINKVPAGLLEDFRGDQPPHTIVIRGGVISFIFNILHYLLFIYNYHYDSNIQIHLTSLT